MTRRTELLDYARFAAAMSVLAFHYLFAGIRNGKLSSLSHIPVVTDIAKYGYLGVEFFFMISGYVIYVSAKDKSPGQFVVSRAVRLYPAFCVAMLLTASVATFWGGPKMGVSLGQVLVNLTMAPALFGVSPVDGVYWTLLVELTFYAAVLAVLLARLERFLDTLFLLWPVALLLAALAGKGHWPLLGGYYPFFSAGALFALIGERKSPTAIAGVAACLWLCVSGAIERAAASPDFQGMGFSDAVIGAIVALQFGFFALLHTSVVRSARLPGSRLAGALTYPIYLLHAHLGYMLLSRFASDQNRVRCLLLVVAGILVAAWALHAIIERRLARHWQALFESILGRPLDTFVASLHRQANSALSRAVKRGSNGYGPAVGSECRSGRPPSSAPNR